MHSRSTRGGFTLIEMLVALVVGGLLMASLVALSGTVQRSFGRSKEITDLQNSLRYGIKMLAADMARAGFMHSPKPANDYGHVDVTTGGLGPGDLAEMEAVHWVPPILDLYGNYVSARDYLWYPATKKIGCRNDIPPEKGEFETCNNPGHYYERYLLPFADGPADLDYVFCTGMVARIEASHGRFAYHRVTGVSNANFEVDMNVSQDKVAGAKVWINPINRVRYQLKKDDSYNVRYNNATDAAERWQLFRQIQACRAGVLTEDEDLFLSEYLLPPTGPRPGLEVSAFEDRNASLNTQSPNVDLTVPPNGFYPDSGYSITPEQMRGMVVTLRGRSHTEDPEFVIPDYTSDEKAAMRFGVDLDGEPANGLAHVREMITVVEIANLGLGPS